MNENLVKVVVDIPEGDLGIFGEGLWAKPLGTDLYEVQNSPWHTLEINYLDVVKAIAPAPDKNPVFVAVERRGGHRTIHIFVLERGVPHKSDILENLNKFGATYEGTNGSLFALDFAPNVDWEPAKGYLGSLEAKGWLDYRWSAH